MRYELVIASLLVTFVMLEAKMLDMSHALNRHSHHGQIFRNFSLTLTFNQSVGASPWFRANDMSLAEHTGTHMDAPVHSFPSGQYLHEIPYQKFVGPAVVLNLKEQSKSDQDYALTVEDLTDHEQKYGRIPDGAIILLNTGGSELYHDAVKYLGTEKTWDMGSMHFPGFSAEATKWLIRERMVKGIGSDRLSFDIGKAHDFPVHGVIGKANVFGLENVANTQKIPERGATVVVLPMPIEWGTGGPTRIMAFWGDENKIYYSGGWTFGGNLILMMICFIFSIHS